MPSIATAVIHLKSSCAAETGYVDIPTRVEVEESGCLEAGQTTRVVLFYPSDAVSSITAHVTAGSIVRTGSCTVSRTEVVAFTGCSANTDYPIDALNGGSWQGTVFARVIESGTERLQSGVSPSVTLKDYRLVVSDCREGAGTEGGGFICDTGGGGGGSVTTGIYGAYSVTYTTSGDVFTYTAPSSVSGEMDAVIIFAITPSSTS